MHMKQTIGRQIGSAVLALFVGCSLLVAGCGQKDPDLPPPGSPAAQAQNPFVNNPAAGKPNHMSPEMQAQIDHLRQMGNQGGANAAPAPAPGQ